MSSTTRTDILCAADALFYDQGLRSVSIDAIARKAGVTRRTLYNHFPSKDDLIAASLATRDGPTIERYRRWLAEGDGDLAPRVEQMFAKLAAYGARPRWKGCGFTRAAVELAGLPGHPAVRMAANHKRRFEDWLRGEFEAGQIADAETLARQVIILLDGAIAHLLIHHDTSYATCAGKAATQLVAAASASAGQRAA